MIIFKRWSVLREKRPPGFSISVFGRFAYSLSALVGLTVFGFDRLRLLEFFDVSSPISDRLYANSRTPDIGKSAGLGWLLAIKSGDVEISGGDRKLIYEL